MTLAAAAALFVAVPAVVLAGGSGPIESNIAVSGGQTTWGAAGTVTNSKAFKAVQGLPRLEAGNLDYDPGAAIHVAVDLRAGRAKLRVRDAGDFDATLVPGSVLLAGEGISSATFLVTGVNTMTDPVLQWKKVGQARVEAKSVTVDVIGPLD